MSGGGWFAVACDYERRGRTRYARRQKDIRTDSDRVVVTDSDRVATDSDRVATDSDLVATGSDLVATDSDRVNSTRQDLLRPARQGGAPGPDAALPAHSAPGLPVREREITITLIAPITVIARPAHSAPGHPAIRG